MIALQGCCQRSGISRGRGEAGTSKPRSCAPHEPLALQPMNHSLNLYSPEPYWGTYKGAALSAVSAQA